MLAQAVAGTVFGNRWKEGKAGAVTGCRHVHGAYRRGLGRLHGRQAGLPADFDMIPSVFSSVLTSGLILLLCKEYACMPKILEARARKGKKWCACVCVAGRKQVVAGMVVACVVCESFLLSPSDFYSFPDARVSMLMMMI